MMRRGAEELDERFTAFVRSRGEHHLRMATLLTGNQDAAEDLVQASLLKLYRAWSRSQPAGTIMNSEKAAASAGVRLGADDTFLTGTQFPELK